MRWLPIDPASWGTLRARLTIWNTAVVLVMSAATLVAFWFGGRAALYREADAVIRGNVREVAIAIADLHPDIDAVVDEMRRKAAGHEDRGWFTQLLTEDGTTLWKSPRCPTEVADFPPTLSDTLENIVQVGPYRYVRVAIARPEQPPLHVRIGMSTEFLDDNVQALMRLLIPVGALLSLLTPLAGYWLAVRATQPVADILHTAERLRPTRLGDRLPEQGTADELDRLSRQINRLLDQVAAHVDRQEQFVADAAHELRGPLAAIQSALEVAMAQDRSADEQPGTSPRWPTTCCSWPRRAMRRRRGGRRRWIWPAWPARRWGCLPGWPRSGASGSSSRRAPRRPSAATPPGSGRWSATCSTTPSGSRRRGAA